MDWKWFVIYLLILIVAIVATNVYLLTKINQLKKESKDKLLEEIRYVNRHIDENTELITNLAEDLGKTRVYDKATYYTALGYPSYDYHVLTTKFRDITENERKLEEYQIKVKEEQMGAD